jgi:hypothetical protein
LRQVIEEPIEEVYNSYFMKIGLKVIKGLLQTEDSTGFNYTIPIYMINEPTNYGIEEPQFIYPDDLYVNIKGSSFNDFVFKLFANENFHSIKLRLASILKVIPHNMAISINNSIILDGQTPESLNIPDSSTLVVSISQK